MKSCVSIVLSFVAFGLAAQPKSIINRADTNIYLPYHDGKATFSYDGKMGIIDSSGKVIVPASFDRLLRLFEKDGDFPYRFYYNGKEIGVLDEDFNVVIPVGVYDDIDILFGNFFRVKKKGRYSFIDTTGRLIGTWFERAGYFSDNYQLAPVRIENKWGFINRKGEVVIEAKFRRAGPFTESGLAGVKIQGKWGFIDTAGAIVIEPKFQQISGFSNGVWPAKFKGKWGYINTSGETVIPFIYNQAEPFYSDLALVKKGRFGFINRTNEVVIGFNYRKAYSFCESCTRTRVKIGLFSNWISINKQGECVIGCD